MNALNNSSTEVMRGPGTLGQTWHVSRELVAAYKYRSRRPRYTDNAMRRALDRDAWYERQYMAGEITFRQYKDNLCNLAAGDDPLYLPAPWVLYALMRRVGWSRETARNITIHEMAHILTAQRFGRRASMVIYFTEDDNYRTHTYFMASYSLPRDGEMPDEEVRALMRAVSEAPPDPSFWDLAGLLEHTAPLTPQPALRVR